MLKKINDLGMTISKKLPVFTSVTLFLWLFIVVEILSILVTLIPSLFVTDDMVIPLSEFGIGLTTLFVYFRYKKKWAKKYPGYRMCAYRTGRFRTTVYLIYAVFTAYIMYGNLSSENLSFSPKIVITALLFGIGAALFEEITVRGILIPRFLAISNNRFRTWIIAVVTATLFSSLHLSNMLLGASLSQTMGQAAYTLGMGLLFAAILIYTGSAVPGIICHFLTDFTAFLNTDVIQANGVLVADASEQDMKVMIIFAVVTLIAGAVVMILAESERKGGDLWEIDPNYVSPDKITSGTIAPDSAT